jgi:hypothetical protein
MDDVLAARNQTSGGAIPSQAIGCSARWEWRGHLLPLDFLRCCYLLLQIPCTRGRRPAPFLPSSVSAGACASHLIDGRVDKEMTLISPVLLFSSASLRTRDRRTTHDARRTTPNSFSY